MLIAWPCALPSCPDCTDPLATGDGLSGRHRDHSQVTIDRSVSMRIVGDDHDETTQIAVVAGHGNAAVCRCQHVGSDAARYVEAAVTTQSRIAFRAPPITKARENSRSSTLRGSHHSQETHRRQNHQQNRGDGVGDQGHDPKASLLPVPSDGPNDGVHKRKQEQPGTHHREARKEESRHPVGDRRRGGADEHQYSRRQGEPEDRSHRAAPRVPDSRIKARPLSLRTAATIACTRWTGQGRQPGLDGGAAATYP
jgi:hypothetical protein